jgi:hypothetical protein
MSRARDTANQINRVNSSAADATAITVDSSENVLIGQTTDSTPYDNTSGNGILLGDGLISSAQEGGNTAIFNRMTSDGSIVQFRKDGTTVGSIGTNLFSEGVEFGIKSNTGQLTLGTTSASKHLQFDSDQFYPSTDGGAKLGHSGGRFSDLYLSGGVYLGGTGSANKLDDFETGHWTPTLPNGGTVGTVHDSTYVKVGNLVTVYCNADLTPTNNSSVFQIGNLPFSQNNNGNHGGGAISYVGGMDVRHWSNPLVHDSSNKIYFHRHDNSSDVIRNAEFGGSQKQFIVQIAYMLG